MENIKLGKLMARSLFSNLLAGAGTIFNISGGYTPLENPEYGDFETDWDAIGDDFKQVGSDLESTMRRYKNESGNKHA